MQTTGTLRTSYLYHHHDYGRLDECRSLSRPQVSRQAADNEHDQLLLLQHHQHLQPHFDQPPSVSLQAEQQNQTANYDGQQHQGQIFVYDLDRSETNNYSQQQHLETGQTTTTTPTTANTDGHTYTLSDFSLEYQHLHQQQQSQSLPSGEAAIYYEPTPTVAYATDERASLELDSTTPRDRLIYCEPFQPTNLRHDNSASLDTSNGQALPQSVYFHYYPNGQQNSIDPGQVNSEIKDGNIYEDDHLSSQFHHQQQVYQNLESVAQKQPTPIARPDNPHQLHGLSTPEVDSTPTLEKASFSCYADQMQLFTNDRFENNTNDIRQHDPLVDGYDSNRQESYSSNASSISDSSSEDSSNSTLTKDEKKARDANLPMVYNEIVNLSIDQFNEQLARHSLTESQLQLIKNIRRRGKNKVAAQSCRKRKMEQIDQLQHEVSDLANRRINLEHECDQLNREYEKLAQDYNNINAIVQRQMLLQQQQPSVTCVNQAHLSSTC